MEKTKEVKSITMTPDELKSHVDSEVKKAVVIEEANKAPLYATVDTTDEVSAVKTMELYIKSAHESAVGNLSIRDAAEKFSKDAPSGLKSAYDKITREEEMQGKSRIAMSNTEFIIPTNISNFIAEKPGANEIFRNLSGYHQETMKGANLTVRKEDVIATAEWVDYEYGTSTGSSVGYKPVDLVPKRIEAKQMISNETLSNVDFMTNSNIVQGLERAIYTGIDTALLYGAGGSKIPLGLNENLQAAYIKAMTGSPTYQTFYSDILGVLKAIRNRSDNTDISTDDIVLIGSSNVELGMESFMTAEGVIPFANIGNGKFGRYKFIESNIVKSNVGTGTQTELFFMDVKNLVVGRSTDKTMKIITSGSLTIDGSVVSIDDRRQAGYIMSEVMDFGWMRNDTSGKLNAIAL